MTCVEGSHQALSRRLYLASLGEFGFPAEDTLPGYATTLSQRSRVSGPGSRWRRTCTVACVSRSQTIERTLILTSALTIALVVLPARAQGVPLDDPRWAPWLGCWRLVQDDHEPPAAATAIPDGTLVCVYPASADRGVGVTTFVGARTVAQRTVVADGAGRPVSQPGCNGSQQIEWSLTGQQLLTRGEIACHGQPARTISGITLMIGGPTWLDIQAVGTDQDARIRLRRYQRAGSPPEGVVLPADLQEWVMVGTTRAVGPTSLTVNEIIDASGKIAASALEAALRETGSPFDLNGVLGADVAGVPQDAVDTAFPHPNWWSNFDFPYHPRSPRPVVVVQGGPARQSGRSPSWWADRYSGRPPPSAVVPAAPARPGGGGTSWWADRYSGRPPPSAVVPAAPARPGGSPSWWADRNSTNP